MQAEGTYGAGTCVVAVWMEHEMDLQVLNRSVKSNEQLQKQCKSFEVRR